MKKIFHNLYYGKINNFERIATITDEESELINKLEEERKHFSFIMSPEDFKRFENFEYLNMKLNDFKDMRTFVYALKFGISLMCAVFMDEDAEE